jgi:hypothetical protein
MCSQFKQIVVIKPHPKPLSEGEGLKKVSPIGGDLEGALKQYSFHFVLLGNEPVR